MVNNWKIPVTSTFTKRVAWKSKMEEEGIESGTFLKPKRKQESDNKTCGSINMKTVEEFSEQETDQREAKLSFSKQRTRQSQEQ